MYVCPPIYQNITSFIFLIFYHTSTFLNFAKKVIEIQNLKNIRIEITKLEFCTHVKAGSFKDAKIFRMGFHCIAMD